MKYFFNSFFAELNINSKTVLVFLLALIVFDFYSFEGPKTHFTGEAYIYIYMHIILLSIIMVFSAIDASNQGIICFSIIFQPSCFILYFIFPMNLAFSMNFVIMTSPRYYDVTHFLTDADEICIAYVEIGNKRHFVHENFLIF